MLKQNSPEFSEHSGPSCCCDETRCCHFLVLPHPRLLELWFGQISSFSFLIMLNLRFESVSGQAKPWQHSRCCEMDEATLFNVVAFDNEGCLDILSQCFSRLGHQPSCVTRVSPLRFNTPRDPSFKKWAFTFHHDVLFRIAFHIFIFPKLLQLAAPHLNQSPCIAARVPPCPATPGPSPSHFFLAHYI